MNDQISTVGAGQDVFTRGQRGPHGIVLEQRVAGSFFDFSLTHPARSEGVVVQQRERPRRSVTADELGPASLSRPKSASRCAAALTGNLRGRLFQDQVPPPGVAPEVNGHIA
jgi:hypothetical protein